VGEIKTVELTEAQHGIGGGLRRGDGHAFRVRCQMILLKSEERTSAEVAGIKTISSVV
jgi:hypothetical protein